MRRWKLVLAVVAAIVVAGWTVAQLRSAPTTNTLCRSPQLLSAPKAPTEAAAVAAFVRDNGGHPSDWRRTQGHDWAPRGRRSDAGFESVRAEHGPDGWSVSGGCAAADRPPDG